MASIVKSLRLIADETRLRLLLLLQKEELSVVEIQQILGLGQSRISMHLGQLRQAGLVQDRRAGKNIYYALTDDPAHAEFASVIAASAKELPEAARDHRQERATEPRADDGEIRIRVDRGHNRRVTRQRPVGESGSLRRATSATNRGSDRKGS